MILYQTESNVDLSERSLRGCIVNTHQPAMATAAVEIAPATGIVTVTINGSRPPVKPDTIMACCLRFSLLVLYFFLALMGLLLIGGGIWKLYNEKSAKSVEKVLQDNIELKEAVEKVEGLEETLENLEMTHAFVNYALLVVGGVMVLVAGFGYCCAKKESACLLGVYSFAIFIVLILQIAAIFLINFSNKDIEAFKSQVKAEAEKIGLDLDQLKQTVFFSVTAALSGGILVVTLMRTCRARKEEGQKKVGKVGKVGKAGK